MEVTACGSRDANRRGPMGSQNIQDSFLNNARKERFPITIYLTSGVKLSGRVRGFDKFCIEFETSHQTQLIFKHAISTIVAPRHGQSSHRGAERPAALHAPAPAPPSPAAPASPADPPPPAALVSPAAPPPPAALVSPADPPPAALPHTDSGDADEHPMPALPVPAAD